MMAGSSTDLVAILGKFDVVGEFVLHPNSAKVKMQVFIRWFALYNFKSGLFRSDKDKIRVKSARCMLSHDVKWGSLTLELCVRAFT